MFPSETSGFASALLCLFCVANVKVFLKQRNGFLLTFKTTVSLRETFQWPCGWSFKAICLFFFERIAHLNDNVGQASPTGEGGIAMNEYEVQQGLLHLRFRMNMHLAKADGITDLFFRFMGDFMRLFDRHSGIDMNVHFD